MIKRFLMPFILIAWIAAVGNAQTSAPAHRKWEFNIFGGTSSMSETTHTTPVTGIAQQTSRKVGLKYGIGGQLGAQITENLGQHWAGSLEYSFSNQPLTFKNLADAIPAFGASQSVHRFEYNFAYYPMKQSKRLRPYAFAGPGIALFYIHKNSRTVASSLGMNLSSPWKPTINWGGGAKFLFADHMAVNGQISDAISGVPRYGLPKTADAGGVRFSPGFLPDGLIHNWRISIGFVYQWDDY